METHGEQRSFAMRRIIGLLLCAVAPTSFLLLMLEEPLLEAGVLNKKDLALFVGKESGTFREYLLNVWHWDGVIFIFLVAAIPSLIFGVSILRGRGPEKRYIADPRAKQIARRLKQIVRGRLTPQPLTPFGRFQFGRVRIVAMDDGFSSSYRVRLEE